MEIRYKLYPYPVLTYYLDNYKTSNYDVAVDLNRNGYNIKIDFTATLTNQELHDLIKNGKACFVYHLECVQTGYREVVKTQSIAESYIVSNKRVNGRLQICPFIVALENLDCYTNQDLDDDYSGITFDIEAGCVLAVGKQVNADISKNTEDLANMPSVFSIVRNADPTVTQMLVEMFNQKIVIKLPLNDYYCYKQLSKAPETQAILNSLTIIPTLTYVLEEIKGMDYSDKDDLEQYLWYHTVRKTLLNKFDCDITSEDFQGRNMLQLAQELINDPMSDAFTGLTSGF